MQNGLLSLKVVDGLTLESEYRALLKPGALVRDSDGRSRRLPRFFYEVESWAQALETQLSAHFALWEFMDVDLHEPLRAYPRHVPCAVTVLAAHLEVVRSEVGAPMHIAANGGYRSPAHAKTAPSSPHCWGTAANIYRIGHEYLNERAKIERCNAVATRVLPALHARPFGSEPRHADDHVHLDLGYVTVVPPDAPGED